MAQHKSAAKRARQSERRRQRNAGVKTRVRGAIKIVNQQIEAGDAAKAAEALETAIPIIDKASSQGALHKRNAARKISRLSRKVAALAG